MSSKYLRRSHLDDSRPARRHSHGKQTQALSSPHDYRHGHGYIKPQKTPSLGTGLGSEYPMGSSKTGIYPEPDSYEIDDDDFPFENEEDIASFISMTNLGYRSSDSVRPRSDRSSYGHSSNKFSTFA